MSLQLETFQLSGHTLNSVSNRLPYRNGFFPNSRAFRTILQNQLTFGRSAFSNSSSSDGSCGPKSIRCSDYLSTIQPTSWSYRLTYLSYLFLFLFRVHQMNSLMNSMMNMRVAFGISQNTANLGKIRLSKLPNRTPKWTVFNEWTTNGILWWAFHLDIVRITFWKADWMSDWTEQLSELPVPALTQTSATPSLPRYKLSSWTSWRLFNDSAHIIAFCLVLWCRFSIDASTNHFPLPASVSHLHGAFNDGNAKAPLMVSLPIQSSYLKFSYPVLLSAQFRRSHTDNER